MPRAYDVFDKWGTNIGKAVEIPDYGGDLAVWLTMICLWLAIIGVVVFFWLLIKLIGFCWHYPKVGLPLLVLLLIGTAAAIYSGTLSPYPYPGTVRAASNFVTENAQPATPVPTATTLPSAARATATRPAAVAPTPASPTTLYVGNTGGDGVYLRHTPSMADKWVALPDGTRLLVVGPDTDGDSHHWKHVSDPTGEVGWVPAEYTVTTAPAPETRVVVGNTGGDGTNLRAQPRSGDILAAWPDGTVVVVVGPDQVVDGEVWKNVRDSAGNRGWIIARYLRPAP
jgi:SH3-like domain-containing protein